MQREYDAREDGIEKGLEQGLEQGLAQGKREIALNLIEKGYSLNEIVDITRLTRAQIHELMKIDD